MLALCIVPACGAAEQWIRLKSANFELLTTVNEKKAREAILYFEEVRAFFVQSSSSKRAPGLPIRIVVFKSEREYKPYRPNEVAVAFYQGTSERDYIVMGALSEETYPIAIHEYTHVVIQHSDLKPPIWLNEGLAEMYSTLKPLGKKILVGALSAGRMNALQEKWVDLSVLISAGHDSPLYNEKNRAGIFYAESWALTHMLSLSPAYKPKFTDFLRAVSMGNSSANAFQTIYGKSVLEVQTDLHAYMNGGKFQGVLFDLQLDKSAEAPEVEPASGLDVGLTLAELRGASPAGQKDAEAAYATLARDYPKSAEVAVGAARLAWAGKNIDAALVQFARAVELGTTDPKVYFDYAMLSRQSRGTADQVSLLEKAVSLKPDYKEARLALAYDYMNAHKYPNAIEHLRQVKQVTKDEAFAYFSALAFANNGIGNPQEARKNAEAAKRYASAPAETESIANLLQYLDRKEKRSLLADIEPTIAKNPPPARVETSNIREIQRPTIQEKRISVAGLLNQVDCLGKSARFHITAQGQKLTLLVPDPAQIELRGVAAQTFDMTCGPQKPMPVVVDYVEQADPKQHTQGTLRVLELK